jgi:GntR family transcriptional regulator / MocR family aminotransferase
VAGERELLVRLDRDAAEPLARQLSDSLRDAIRCGKLHPGTRLPATRTLAADLGVSRGVVVEAYEQLIAEGYLDTRAGGAGTFVKAIDVRATGSGLGSRLLHRETRAAVLDARPGAPDLAAFPRSLWSAAVRSVLHEAADLDLGYPAPWGVPALREQLASYLGRVRGAIGSPDTLVVTTGATQALSLTARVLLARGHRSLAVEDPSNHVHRTLLARHGMRIVPVAIDQEGIDIAALEHTGARAVLVTPAHQFPSGALMSPARRQALLQWARAADAVIIEDDYDAEFRYDGQSTMCLQGDDPMRVALVGSVSKTLAPALRLGWIMPPMGLVRAVAELKRDDDLGSETLTQLAFARLLHTGRYDKHLRTTRDQYRQRRQNLVQELRTHLRHWNVKGLAAGQHVSVELPADLDEASVAEQARQRGLLVLETSPMRTTPGPPTLVLGFARLTGSMPRQVAQTLATAAAACARQTTPQAQAPTGRTWQPSGPAATLSAIDYYDPPTRS